jgi:hypothetical protein
MRIIGTLADVLYASTLMILQETDVSTNNVPGTLLFKQWNTAQHTQTKRILSFVYRI